MVAVVAIAVAPVVAVAAVVAAEDGANTASPDRADAAGMIPRLGVAVPACIPRVAYIIQQRL